jgi:hypothetical protein
MLSRKILALAVASVCSYAVAQPTVTSTEPIALSAPNGKVAIKLSQPVTPADGQIAAILSPVTDRTRKADITTLAQLQDDTVTIDFANAPVSEGGQQVRLFLVGADGAWSELGAVVLQLEAAAAVDPNAKPAFTPKLDVGVVSQVTEHARGSARQSARPHYTNLTMQGSVETFNAGDDWEVKSQLQLAGSSYRQDAPNFGKLGANAPKLDISSYLIEAGWRDSRFSGGHISVDSHPLLLSGINNRGIAFQQKLPLGIDMAISAQNGESIVGYRNLAGLANRNNQHRSIGLGYDIRQDRPGFFRVDINATDNRVFNGTTETGDPLYDHSRGRGARALWRNDAGTLRLEGVAAKSEFAPAKPDPGAPASTTGDARTGEIGYDLLKDWKYTDQLPISLSIAIRNEFSSPHFRSLGSGYGSNFRLNAQTFTLKAGVLSAQWQATQRYDNVDQNRLYIRNRVGANTFTMSLPIAQFFLENLGSQRSMFRAPPAPPAPAPAPAATAPAAAPEAAVAAAAAPESAAVAAQAAPASAPEPAVAPDPATATPAPTGEPANATASAPATEPAAATPAATAAPETTAVAAAAPPPEPPKPSPWWPTLSLTQQLNHGFGDPGYVPAGYTNDDLPNVRVTNRAFGLGWQFERISFGIKSNRTDQKNLQKDKENLSTWDKRYSASFEWKITDALTLGMGYDPSYNYRYESGTRADARQLRGNTTWNITEEWQLTGEINHSADSESTSSKYNRVNASQMQISRRFSIPIEGWKKLPTQIYMRVTESRGFNNSGTGVPLEPRILRIQLGCTITLF